MSLKLPIVSLPCPINAITMHLSWYPNILFYHRHSFFFCAITAPCCVTSSYFSNHSALLGHHSKLLDHEIVILHHNILFCHHSALLLQSDGRLCITLSCFAMAMPIGPSWCCVIPSQCSTASSQCFALGAVIMGYVSHHSDMLFSCRILCPFLFIT